MSEKKNKHKIDIPIYDVEPQMDFITSVCNSMKFDAKVLITLIFADWICNFQEISSIQGPEKALLSYLSSCKSTRDKLIQLREVVENGKK